MRLMSFEMSDRRPRSPPARDLHGRLHLPDGRNSGGRCAGARGALTESSRSEAQVGQLVSGMCPADSELGAGLTTRVRAALRIRGARRHLAECHARRRNRQHGSLVRYGTANTPGVSGSASPRRIRLVLCYDRATSPPLRYQMRSRSCSTATTTFERPKWFSRRRRSASPVAILWAIAIRRRGIRTVEILVPRHTGRPIRLLPVFVRRCAAWACGDPFGVFECPREHPSRRGRGFEIAQGRWVWRNQSCWGLMVRTLPESMWAVWASGCLGNTA